MARKKSGDNKVQVGDIHEVSGEVNIAAGDIYKGFAVEQVSALIKQITTTFQPKPFDGRCPYKGLDVFEEEDAELFFGREKSVEDLLSRVKDSRTVFITGPSGSGKSSLVRAGLIPALKQGAIKNSERWLYETMKPGRDPIGELARVASSLANSTNAEDEIRAKAMTDETIFARWCEIALKEGRDKRVVLFIDQFEEVFTQISREEERAAFLNLLTGAATVEDGRVVILFSMRSDFVSNCATYPQVNALLNQQFVQIGAMQPHELVSAMAQPALRVGLRIDPDLIAQIINDMKGEPGALPLMQFTLKDLFDAGQAKGGVISLTLNDYLQHGGIQKSLERHADAAFAKLGANEQELARSIFSGLIEIGRGTQDTKRTALFEELVPAHAKAEDVQTIVGKLADARLITTDEAAGKDTVTISHEKLIDAWPWLKKLVNENRDVIALQNEIAEDAKEWEEHKRDASYLYSGGRLANIWEQVQRQKLALGQLAQEFVKAGRRRQQRTRAALISMVSLVLIAAILASVVFQNQAQTNIEIANTAQAASTYAVQQQEIAQANAEKAIIQANISRARELTVQSIEVREKNFQLSLLLGIEAFQHANIARTRDNLLNTTIANPQLLCYLMGASSWVTSVAFSLDRKILASGSWDGTILLWNIDTHQPIDQGLIGHSEPISEVAFSPDGKMLASGSLDDTIILWDVETHQPIGQPLSGHSVSSVAFSPDGKIIASGGDTIILWDLETRQPIGHPLGGHSENVSKVAFSPDGTLLASGSLDGTIILWNVETRQPIGQPLGGNSDQVTGVAFSPDGNILASGSFDNTITLWNVETRQPIGQSLTGHSGPISEVAFSPDGTLLASGSLDGTIILWDIETHQPIGQPLSGHSSIVSSVDFSPDGGTLVSGSEDTTIILWDIETHQPIGQPLSGHSSIVSTVAFSPDGDTLASGSEDNTIILWDIDSRQPIGQPLPGYYDGRSGLAFSPDGKTLASGGSDNTIILWDIDTRQPIGQPLIGAIGVEGVAFNLDGKTLASGSFDGTIILWDVITRQPIGQPLSGHSGPISEVAFSPDGKILASLSFDGITILWDVETRQPIGQLLPENYDGVSSIAFSPDGKILASSNKSIILWDVESHQPIGQPLPGNYDGISSLAFSPDGKTLASGSDSIILWDVETRQPIGQPLSILVGWVYSLAYSPDGKALASGIANEIILWNVDPESWAENACLRTGRNFTRTEWIQYFPNEEYRKTCEQWPLEPEPTTTP